MKGLVKLFKLLEGRWWAECKWSKQTAKLQMWVEETKGKGFKIDAEELPMELTGDGRAVGGGKKRERVGSKRERIGKYRGR